MKRPEWQAMASPARNRRAATPAPCAGGEAPSPSTLATREQGTGPAPNATATANSRPDPIAALEARMTPADIAASDRLVAEAPPLTPGQIAALRSLLGPLMRARRAA